MINHLRTLLLNESGEAALGESVPAEEFVPPEFRPVRLTRELAEVRNVLFGVAPDRAMLDYRLRQLMALLHASPLSDYITAKDPRITYWPFRDNDLFVNSVYGTTITQLAGDRTNFYLQGDPRQLTDSERLLRRWRVTVVDSDTVEVSAMHYPYSIEEFEYASVDGISAPALPLIGSNLSFLFQTNIGAIWLIESLFRPHKGIADIIRELDTTITASIGNALFGVRPVEPYTTFSNLWHTSKQGVYRLCGVLLALAYRIDEIRGA